MPARFGLLSGIVLLRGGEPPRPVAVDFPTALAGLLFDAAISSAFQSSPTFA